VFREQHHLPNMRRVMRHLPIDGLHDGMRFSSHRDSFFEIVRGQRGDRPRETVPSRVPAREDVGSCFVPVGLEFGISMAIRFLTVGSSGNRSIATAGCLRHAS
jgi:hypothetical protein